MIRIRAFFMLSMLSISVGTAQHFDKNLTESIAKSEARSYYSDIFEYREKIDLKMGKLAFEVDPRLQYIKGEVTFAFQPLEAVNSITFDAHDSLSIALVTFKSDTLAYEHQNHTLIIDFPTTLSANTIDSITIAYEGNPPLGPRAGFVTSQRTSAGDYALYTLSQPYGAREWWPVRQALGDRLDSVEISITVPSQFKGISNGLITNQFSQGNSTTTVWKHRYSIPPYLVALAVADYVSFQDTIHINNDTLLYENYLFQDQANEIGQLDALKDMMHLFEEIAIDYPYPKEKYGHTMWERGGGMEHTTNSFMGNFSWELQAHELAHMWFGDLVTCASWRDIWLNEGFASYYTGLTYEFIPKVQKYWPIWKQTRLHTITSKADGSVYVYDTTEVSRVFDFRLSYRKAAYVLHMLRWQIGDEVFFSAINTWLTSPKRKFGFGSTEDFIAHFESQTGKDLTEFFNDWLYQQGHPSYQLFWEQKEGLFSGELYQTTSHHSVDFFEMTVPIRLYSTSGDSTDVLFEHTSSGQRFSEPIGFKVDSVAIDPDLWLISDNNQIHSLQEKNQLNVFPNPAEDFINLSYPGPEGTIFSIQLLNMNGQIVKQTNNLSLSFYRLDISGMPTGTYQLIVQTGNGRFKEKVIIY